MTLRVPDSRLPGQGLPTFKEQLMTPLLIAIYILLAIITTIFLGRTFIRIESETSGCTRNIDKFDLFLIVMSSIVLGGIWPVVFLYYFFKSFYLRYFIPRAGE